jgi:hypothetical protein
MAGGSWVMESDGTQFLTSLGLWDICENCCTACTPLDPDDSTISANLQAWLKADAITGLSDGDAIGTWSDSSGNGNDATQSTSGSKPLYKTGIYSGATLPTVRFDGTDDYLYWGTFFNSFENSEWTAFIVVKNQSGEVGFAVSNHAAFGFTANGFHLYAFPEVLTAKDYVDSSTPYRDIVSSTGLTLNALHSYAASVKNDASTRNKIFVGGVDVSAPQVDALTGAITEDVSTNTGVRVGATFSIASSTFYLNGDICEIIVYDTVLTDAQIVGVQCYLNRWTT